MFTEVKMSIRLNYLIYYYYLLLLHIRLGYELQKLN